MTRSKNYMNCPTLQCPFRNFLLPYADKISTVGLKLLRWLMRWFQEQNKGLHELYNAALIIQCPVELMLACNTAGLNVIVIVRLSLLRKTILNPDY